MSMPDASGSSHLPTIPMFLLYCVVDSWMWISLQFFWGRSPQDLTPKTSDPLQQDLVTLTEARGLKVILPTGSGDVDGSKRHYAA